MSYGHHHHHHQQPEYVEEYSESERVYNAPPAPAYASYERVNSGYYERPPPCAEGGYNHHHHNAANPNNYQRNERLGELGAVAAGAFALYEGHKAKVDPANAARHKLEEEVAGIGALGSAGYGYSEHREKNKFEDRIY